MDHILLQRCLTWIKGKSFAFELGWKGGSESKFPVNVWSKLIGCTHLQMVQQQHQ